MTQNLSPVERDVRLAVVTPILLLVAVGAGLLTAVGILAFVLATATAATALAGYCPMYDLIGVGRSRQQRG